MLCEIITKIINNRLFRRLQLQLILIIIINIVTDLYDLVRVNELTSLPENLLIFGSEDFYPISRIEIA